MAVFLAALGAGPAHGQTPAAPQTDESSLKRLSIEELSRINVTSTMKYAEPVREAAAAIQVISGDDIRRAGITTLPEALRLATGVQVARFDGRTWAISARGFNISTANKLVVMIDGRSVYTPLFSGVFWDVQDVVLEDVDRIEVIRGPGATLWGANAVNGVINIVTQAGGGDRRHAGAGRTAEPSSARPRVRLRHPAWAAAAPSRVLRQVSAIATARGSRPAPALAIHCDSARRGSASKPACRAAPLFTLQGDVYKGKHRDRGSAGQRRRRRQPARRASAIPGARDRSCSSRPTTTARTASVPRQFAEHRDTLDLEAAVSNGRKAAARHRHGPRLSGDARARHAEPGAVSSSPRHGRRRSPTCSCRTTSRSRRDVSTSSSASKVEHNDYTGIEYQPSARLRWTTGEQTIWGRGVPRRYACRRVSTPTCQFTGPAPFVVLRGDPAFHVRNGRARRSSGIAARFRPRLSVDLASFVNIYDDLRTQEPSPPAGLPIVLSNMLNARTAGIESDRRLPGGRPPCSCTPGTRFSPSGSG